MNDDARCDVCDQPFTDDEWEQRHSPDAEPDADVHERCCPDCAPETDTTG